MKKIYTLVCAIAISSLGIAQTQKTFNPALAKPAKQMSFNKSTAVAKRNNNSAVSKSAVVGNAGWFNYAFAAEDLFNPGASALNSNYLFPDSMGYGEFGTGNFSACWIHHLAEMVDFRSAVFSTDPKTSWVGANPTAPFKIDSMSIVYGYTRTQNVTDTLIVTVYDNQTAANFSTSGFAGATAANYNTDTVSFKRIGYNQAGNFIAAPTATTGPQNAPAGKKVFKILLTDQDTAIAAYREKMFALATPFSSIGGKLVVGSVMFKPGYAYALGDHIDATGNAFFFTSLEEMGDGGGAGTFMNYFDCNFGSAACDYSQSFVLPQDVRYNMAASWNYRFIPTLAYTITYGFEHHLISFHLTDDMATGVKDQLASSGMLLGQNVPNPYTKESTVNFQLAKDASSVLFTVTDVMGRVVSSEKVGTSQGSHSVKLGAYASGVYYYSLNVDGNVTTKKMIVE